MIIIITHITGTIFKSRLPDQLLTVFKKKNTKHTKWLHQQKMHNNTIYCVFKYKTLSTYIFTINNFKYKILCISTKRIEIKYYNSTICGLHKPQLNQKLYVPRTNESCCLMKFYLIDALPYYHCEICCIAVPPIG